MDKQETYILKRDCPKIGKEVGDYYNGEFRESIAFLLANGTIEEEVEELNITHRRFIIVLAGNRGEFDGYMQTKSPLKYIYMYGYSENILRGIVAQKVEVIGTFWDRPDARELHDLAFTRVRN